MVLTISRVDAIGVRMSGARWGCAFRRGGLKNYVGRIEVQG